jgi:hypothetical protein
MVVDSRRGPVPLPEALRAWSDPGLVEAVRQAKAGFAADELDRLARDRAERLAALLGKPAGGQGVGPDPQAERRAALYRAWSSLTGPFRLMVERSDVLLEGTQVRPAVVPRRQRIPAHWAPEMEFDARHAEVAAQGRVYADVTASRASPDPLEVLRAAAADDGRALPLREALVLWGDVALLKRVRRLERQVADVNGWPLRFSRLFERPPKPFDWSTTPVAEQMRPEANLAEAWAELLTDDRRRIEAGEWQVRGVQTFPLREVERAPIPGVWAAEFHFDVEAGKIHVTQFGTTVRSYTAVLVSRRIDEAHGPTPAPARSGAVGDAPVARDVDPAPQGAPAAAEATAPEKRSRKAKGGAKARSGRRSVGPVIEAALREHWDDLFPSGPQGGLPQWSDLARRMRRRMLVGGAGGCHVVPEEETIRTRLPKIYAAVLSEKAGAGESAQ